MNTKAMETAMKILLDLTSLQCVILECEDPALESADLAMMQAFQENNSDALLEAAKKRCFIIQAAAIDQAAKELSNDSD